MGSAFHLDGAGAAAAVLAARVEAEPRGLTDKFSGAEHPLERWVRKDLSIMKRKELICE